MTDQQTRSTLTLENLVESLLFVADGPVPVSQLAAALEIRTQQVKAALLVLEDSCKERGLQLQQNNGRVQLTSHPLAAAAIEHQLAVDLRYVGQGYELTVLLPEIPRFEHALIARIEQLFHAEHRRRYGRSDAGVAIQWVTLRTSVSGRVTRPR